VSHQIAGGAEGEDQRQRGGRGALRQAVAPDHQHQPAIRRQHQAQVNPLGAVRTETHHQRALAGDFVAAAVGEFVDEQNRRNQQGIRQPRDDGHRRKGSALDEVGSDHDDQPPRGHRRLAQPAGHQRQGRRGVSPAEKEPGKADRQ